MLDFAATVLRVNFCAIGVAAAAMLAAARARGRWAAGELSEEEFLKAADWSRVREI